MKEKRIAIIGAGPAGLTAAYLLSQQGFQVTLFEQDDAYVGGISRTVKYDGFYFDLGGHRFFSKSEKVEKFWDEILPDDMLIRPRLSRILYNGKLYSYPLKPFEALFKLGLSESILCVMSYAKAKLFPVQSPKNLEEWVSNQFGKRLFRIFFKTYTEKVWGIDCREISADWVAQRIKGLSLWTAVVTALLPKRKSKVIKTLIHTFRYPRKGPGMLWEACADKSKALGCKLLMGHKVSGLSFKEESKRWDLDVLYQDGMQTFKDFDYVISTAPLRQLILSISPACSKAALDAAKALRYRDFLTVALILKKQERFKDNWIYIHEHHVQVGRIQNYNSWSEEMVPHPNRTCYGLEYFCNEGEALWCTEDSELIELASSELSKLNMADPIDILDGCVARQPKAYPVYDDSYSEHVSVIRKELESHYLNLHLIGRNGMHKYNNQDHAMMTAMLCVENIVAEKPIYNLWLVNQDAEYHEESK